MSENFYNITDAYPDIGPKSAGCFLLVLTIAGLWLRFAGLGFAPLAEDEYYFITSTHNILEHGLPQYASGGYYLRGVLQQYLTALAILAFGDGTFAYRLPAALFGTGTCLMAYLLGRQFVNRTWSILLVAFLVFSSWEIEFSRFARMYASLQFFTVCFFWSLFRFSFDSHSRRRYLPIIFAFISIFTHRLGVFIVAFLFYPLPAWYEVNIRTTLRKHKYYLVFSFLLLLFGFFMAFFRFRYYGVTDYLPPDYVWPASGKRPWADFASVLLGSHSFIFIGAATAILMGTWYARHVRNRWQDFPPEDIFLGGLIVAALCIAVFYQFALSLLCLSVVLLRRPACLIQRPYRYLIASIALLFVFWGALLLFNSSWVQAVGTGDALRNNLRALRLAFFAFPDLYTPILRAWADDIPILGVLIFMAAIWQLLKIRHLSLREILRNPVTAMVIMVIALGIRPPYRIETRYSFFIYPVLLCLAVLSAVSIQRLFHQRLNLSKWRSQFGAIALCSMLFFVSEDLNLSYLFNVSSEAATFRLGKFEGFQNHWYPRWDFQTTAEFIDARATPGDRIVVSDKVNTTGAYLKSDFAVFWPQSDRSFTDISREQGQRELWSNHRLLNSYEDFVKYIDGADKVWLVLYGGEDALKVDPENLWFDRIKSIQKFRPGRDNRIEVWKIVLKEKKILMKLTHLGAENCVTGSCHLLQVNGLNVLVDCGLSQGRDPSLRFEDWPVAPDRIDYLFLTHAHIDHIGRVPEMIQKGFRGEIICSHPTRAMLYPMLDDAMSFSGLPDKTVRGIQEAIDAQSWGFEL